MNEYQQDGPPEQDPDFARLQAQAQGSNQALQNLPLPAAAFLASLNGLTGPVDLNGGTGVNITPGVGTIVISLSGLGTMSTKNVAAAVADIATADAIDLATAIVLVNVCKAKINELLGSLRTAVHIGP